MNNCKWFNKDECGSCNGSIEEFMENCVYSESFIDMAQQCP